MNSFDSGDDLDEWEDHAADPFCFDDPFYDQIDDDDSIFKVHIKIINKHTEIS